MSKISVYRDVPPGSGNLPSPNTACGQADAYKLDLVDISSFVAEAGVRGSSGSDGEEGPQGPPGPVGATGSAGTSGVSGADGSKGSPGDSGEDGQDGLPGFAVFSPDFRASGAASMRGLVPDPGASAGTAKFLREDATWSSPTATVAFTFDGGVDTFQLFGAGVINDSSFDGGAP